MTHFKAKIDQIQFQLCLCLTLAGKLPALPTPSSWNLGMESGG